MDSKDLKFKCKTCRNILDECSSWGVHIREDEQFAFAIFRCGNKECESKGLQTIKIQLDMSDITVENSKSIQTMEVL